MENGHVSSHCCTWAEGGCLQWVGGQARLMPRGYPCLFHGLRGLLGWVAAEALEGLNRHEESSLEASAYTGNLGRNDQGMDIKGEGRKSRKEEA